MPDNYAVLSVGALIGVCAFLMKSWVSGVNKRLEDGDKKFETFEHRLTVVETRMDVKRKQGD